MLRRQGKAWLASAVVLCACSKPQLKTATKSEAIVVPSTSPIESSASSTPPVTSVVRPGQNYQAGPSAVKAAWFVDQADNYGLGNAQAVRIYAVDFDRDGHTDLVLLPDHYSVPEFWRYYPKLKKFQLIENTPMDKPLRASYLNFIDLDKDGLPDLLLSTLNQKSELTKQPVQLYKGRLEQGKIRYEWKSELHETAMPAASLVALDLDLDGQLDLFQANWFDDDKQTPTPVPDELYHSQGPWKYSKLSGLLMGEHTFQKSAELYPQATPSFGASTCDIDQNGYPDILVSTSGGYPNKLWMNLPDREYGRKFVDYGESSGFAGEGLHVSLYAGGNSFYAACADYNLDGIMDLATGELYQPYEQTRDHSAILTGKNPDFPPAFIRTDYDEDDENSRSDHQGTWVDVNLDGLLDLIVENSGGPPSTRLTLLEQQANHAFEAQPEARGIDILNPSGVALIDVNRDGAMDFFVGQTAVRAPNIKRKLYLFVNQVPRAQKQSLRLHLQGQQGNSMGIGATIKLKTKRWSATRWVEYSYGSQPSQHEEGMHFGLGKNNVVTEVQVTWPIVPKAKKAKDKAKEGDFTLAERPLVRKYKLSVGDKTHSEFTLCESGKLLSGKQARKACGK